MAATAPTLRKALQGRSPSLAYERALWDAGHDVVVGMDEVGRGAWAGPLTLGAAVLPRDRRVYKIRDSKQLTERRARGAVRPHRRRGAPRGRSATPRAEECDELGMSEAQRLAARRALEGLGVRPDRVLLDGKWDFVGRRHHPAHRQGRRPLPVDLGGVDPGQGDPRPHHAGRGRALPAGGGSTRTRATRAPATRRRCGASGPRPSTAAAGCSWTSLPWGGVPALVRPDPQGVLFD